MRIDVFAHALTPDVKRRGLELRSSSSQLVLWEKLSPLVDVDARLRVMDANGVDMQILTTAGPAFESILQPDHAMELAALANDGLADLVARYPDRFRAVATVPLLDIDWAIGELRRSVEDMGLVGALLYANGGARPPDAPEYEEFYDEVERLDVPIWLHPDGMAPQYPGEEGSKYGLSLVLGWPYQTSIAMARLVFSGMMLRHPNLKVIAHHAGAMIPFFAKRLELHYPHEGDMHSVSDEVPMPEVPYLEQFKRFYVDTVTQGSVSALMNSYDMFGADRMLLASDFPFGPGHGAPFVEIAVSTLEAMPIPDEEKEKIGSVNAVRLLGEKTLG